MNSMRDSRSDLMCKLNADVKPPEEAFFIQTMSYNTDIVIILPSAVSTEISSILQHKSSFLAYY